jgi:hypothetical protein
MSTKALIFEIIGVDNASDKFDRVGRAVTDSTSKMERLQKVSAVAGRALGLGLAAVAYGAVKATQAAIDDQAAQAQLAQQLKQAAHATDAQVAQTEEYITAAGKAKGVSDDDLRPALARLATATGSVSKAQKLTTLAMDVAAGSGKSLEQVSTALAKAQNGNIGALGRLGIATKDAAGHTKTLGQIQQDLATKYHNAAAKAAETTAGKEKILSVQMHELQEQIGTALIPVMTKLAEVGLTVVNWISQNTSTVGYLLAAFGSLLAVTAAVGAATKAWTAITTIAKVATATWTAIQWALNVALTANPVGLVIVAVAALVAVIIIAYKHSETFRNIVQAAFGAVAKAAGAAVDFIRDHWKLILAILTGPVGIAVGIIASHWDKIRAGAAAVIGWVRDHWPALRDAIVTPIQRAKDALDNIWDNIKDGFSSVRDKIGSVAGAIRDAITNAFNGAKSAIDGVISAIQSLITWVQSAINKIKSIPHPDVNPFNRSALGAVGSAVVGGGKDAIAAAAGVTSLAHRRGAGGDVGDRIVVEVHIDGKKVADGVQVNLLRKKRQTGVALGLA